MKKVNKHAHTHTRIQKNENLKKGNGCFLQLYWDSVPSSVNMIFRTVVTKQINPQVNAQGTYILLDKSSPIVANSEDLTVCWIQAIRFLVQDH